MQLKRDQARESAKAERAEEIRLRNEAARQKAAARMQTTLNANRSILKQRRAEYDKQQADNERRRKCAAHLHLHAPTAESSSN